MMKCTVLCFIFLGVWFGMTFVLGEKFEFECDILERLNTLENKANASEEVIAGLESKVKASEEVIADLQSKVKASEEVNADLESKVKASEDEIADLQSKLAKVEDINDAQTKQLEAQATAGTSYVRWGRTTCPGNGSELVYQGVAGGSHYNDTGAAVNHICLPLDPTYGEYYEDAVQYGGLVYGTEYELNYRSDRMKFFPDIDASSDLLNQNVPCAVCHVAREAMIMVPAKKSCLPGWTLEFKGLLVAGGWTHAAASEYICLDDQPEVINGGQAYEGGKRLYFVEGWCGSLPCPPYVEGRELACAVCTK